MIVLTILFGRSLKIRSPIDLITPGYGIGKLTAWGVIHKSLGRGLKIVTSVVVRYKESV